MLKRCRKSCKLCEVNGDEGEDEDGNGDEEEDGGQGKCRDQDPRYSGLKKNQPEW